MWYRNCSVAHCTLLWESLLSIFITEQPVLLETLDHKQVMRIFIKMVLQNCNVNFLASVVDFGRFIFEVNFDGAPSLLQE